MSSDSGSDLSLGDYDQQYYDRPTVLFVSVLAIIGTIRNIHTLLVYTLSPALNKLSVRSLIVWLAAIDLVACAVCMPVNIYDIRFENSLTSVFACKFFRVVNFATLFSSGGLLTLIAIQIFRITTARLNYQTKLYIRYMALIITIVCFLLASPAYFFVDVIPKETYFHGLNGTDCTIIGKYVNVELVVVYASLLILGVTTCVIVIVFMYSKILYIICYQMKKVSTMQINERPDQEENPSKFSSAAEKYENSTQLTISLIVATFVSYTAFILHVLKSAVVVAQPEVNDNNRLRPVLMILARAFFINNAVNPVVYFLLDKKFRREVLTMYRKIFKI